MINFKHCLYVEKWFNSVKLGLEYMKHPYMCTVDNFILEVAVCLFVCFVLFLNYPDQFSYFTCANIFIIIPLIDYVWNENKQNWLIQWFYYCSMTNGNCLVSSKSARTFVCVTNMKAMAHQQQIWSSFVTVLFSIHFPIPFQFAHLLYYNFSSFLAHLPFFLSLSFPAKSLKNSWCNVILSHNFWNSLIHIYFEWKDINFWWFYLTSK